MARHAIVVGSVIDFEGRSWDVREFRRTKYGFDLAIGWPDGRRGKGYGGPALIPTIELIEYWNSAAVRRGAIYDLPMGRTAIKRLRLVLGMNFYEDVEGWWLDRKKDLDSLRGSHFAKKHGAHESEISQAHTRLIGPRLRARGWWREKTNAEVLLSSLPIREIAQKLKVSDGSARRLRWMLKNQK